MQPGSVKAKKPRAKKRALKAENPNLNLNVSLQTDMDDNALVASALVDGALLPALTFPADDRQRLERNDRATEDTLLSSVAVVEVEATPTRATVAIGSTVDSGTPASLVEEDGAHSGMPTTQKISAEITVAVERVTTSAERAVVATPTIPTAAETVGAVATLAIADENVDVVRTEASTTTARTTIVSECAVSATKTAAIVEGEATRMPAWTADGDSSRLEGGDGAVVTERRESSTTGPQSLSSLTGVPTRAVETPALPATTTGANDGKELSLSYPAEVETSVD